MAQKQTKRMLKTTPNSYTPLYIRGAIDKNRATVPNNEHLKSSTHQTTNKQETTVMSEDRVLVEITASKEKGEIVYRVECDSSLTNEEFEYYLEELISGICTWKKNICQDSIRVYKGKIKKKPK